ncbi:MAG: hypothetical protein KDD69_13935 [Bdellovibrionales bacterium]|nr:hypothetical protein [Bdellovibrionales bacterium]
MQSKLLLSNVVELITKRRWRLVATLLLLCIAYAGYVQGWVFSFEQDMGLEPPFLYDELEALPPIFFVIALVLNAPLRAIYTGLLYSAMYICDLLLIGDALFALILQVGRVLSVPIFLVYYYLLASIPFVICTQLKNLLAKKHNKRLDRIWSRSTLELIL